MGPTDNSSYQLMTVSANNTYLISRSAIISSVTVLAILPLYIDHISTITDRHGHLTVCPVGPGNPVGPDGPLDPYVIIL